MHATGADIYRNFVIPLNLTEDHWVKAIEVRPAGPLRRPPRPLLPRRLAESRARRTARAASRGSPGMAFRRSGSLGGWAVGAIPRTAPRGARDGASEGVGPRPPDALPPVGQGRARGDDRRHPLREQAADALAAPARSCRRSSAASRASTSRPARRRSRIQRVEEDPGRHRPDPRPAGTPTTSARSMKAVAKLPDGSDEEAVRHRRVGLQLAGPLHLREARPPAEGHDDRRRDRLRQQRRQPAQPEHPPKRITWGLESTDEMGAITFVLSPARESDVDALRARSARACSAAASSAPAGRSAATTTRRLHRAHAQGRRRASAHAPLTVDEGKASVIVFIKTDCPISNCYAPELAALGKDLAAKGVPLYLVHVETRPRAPRRPRRTRRSTACPRPILLDPDRRARQGRRRDDHARGGRHHARRRGRLPRPDRRPQPEARRPEARGVEARPARRDRRGARRQAGRERAHQGGRLHHRMSAPAPAFTISPIEPADDAAVAAIIRTVMPEFGAAGAGFAIHDAEVDAMCAAYRAPAVRLLRAPEGRPRRRRRGVAPLLGGEPGTCELRKMYLLADAARLRAGRAAAATLPRRGAPARVHDLLPRDDVEDDPGAAALREARVHAARDAVRGDRPLQLRQVVREDVVGPGPPALAGPMSHVVAYRCQAG